MAESLWTPQLAIVKNWRGEGKEEVHFEGWNSAGMKGIFIESSGLDCLKLD